MAGQTIRLILTTVMGLVLAPQAQAAAITFVASNGNDAAVCSQAAPCRQLQAAHDRTNQNGEIKILDAGSYRQDLTITRSVTISSTGVNATFGHIEIANVNAVVTLRDLHLLGAGAPSTSGIHIVSAKAVHIVGCEIQRFSANGIFVDVGTSPELFVTDTISRENGEDGLRVSGDGTTARVTVENSRFENNVSDGIDVRGVESIITRVVASGNLNNGIAQFGGRATIAWSTAADSFFDGFSLQSSGEMSLENSVARGNLDAGLNVLFQSDAVISNNLFTHNGIGVDNGGEIRSRVNNSIRDNDDETNGSAFQTLDPL